MPKRGSAPIPTSATTAPSPIPSCASNMIRKRPPPTPDRAFARLNQPGIYTTSIARPALFREYLREQLEHLVRDYPVKISVGTSASEIPYPYVLDGGDLDLQGISTAELVALVPLDRPGPYRRRSGRRRLGRGARPDPAAGAVRCAPHRFQPGAPQALYRHPGRAFPALRAVHQLCPLCRRVRALRHRRAARSGQPLHRPVGARRHVRAWRPGRRRGADRGGRVAAAPDAGLSFDDARRRRHHAGQHRRRPVATPRRSATISRCCGPKPG